MRLSWGPGPAALLLAAGMIVYLNALPTPFQFDDYIVVVNDQSLRDSARLWQELPISLRSLTKLSYALNYALAKLEPGSYHLVNLWFHLLSALEIFYLTGKILPNSAPFWAALLFTIHPMQTETVTYISARSNVMMAFFYLAGLIGAIRGLSLWQSGEKKTIKTAAWFAVALLGYLAALASKEAAITLPVAVIIYDLYFLQGTKQQRQGRFLLYALLFALATGIFGLLMLHPRYLRLFHNMLDTLAVRSLGAHILTQPVILVTLLGRFFCPFYLNIDSDYQLISGLEYYAIFALFILFSLLALAIYLFRRLPVLSFGIVWFFVTLLPHIVLPRTDFINERHLYLPSVGILMGLTYLVFQLRWKWMVPLVLGTISLLLGIGTIQRNAVYADELTFWTNAVNKSPNKGRPHNNLGYAYLKQGDLDRAASEFERALELDPGFTKISLNLGYVYLLRRDVGKAREVYLKALRYDPASLELREALTQAGIQQREAGP